MKPFSDLIKDFRNSSKEYTDFQKNLPRHIGILGVKDVRKNFKDEAFNGVKWKQRSPVTNKIYDQRQTKGINRKAYKKANLWSKMFYKGSVYSSKNPLLRQTGNLYDSITYRTSQNAVNIGVNLNIVPYAKKLNEGGSTKFGKKWAYIPKRQFLGYSNRLEKDVKELMKTKIHQAFKKFKL